MGFYSIYEKYKDNGNGGKATEADAAETANFEDTPSGSAVWQSDIVKRRKAVHGASEINHDIKSPEQQQTPAAQEPEINKVDLTDEKKAKNDVVEMATFGPDGKELNQLTHEQKADEKQFEAPVEGFVADEAPKVPAQPIKFDGEKNRAIAQAAMGKEPVISSGPAAQSEELPNDGGGLSEFDKIKANNGSNAVPAALQSQTPNLAEQPVVTIDDIEQSQDQELKPKIAQPTISAKPKELIDPDEVPITVTKTQEDLSAIAPAGETRVPERGNGVDDKVAEIQSRIREGDGRFNNEVKAEIAENQEGTIAPAPEKPGVQTEDLKKPEIHIDGRPGIIGEIKPKEEDREDIDGTGANHQQMAAGVKGDEDSSFFARLTGKFKKQNQSAENLKKAA